MTTRHLQLVLITGCQRSGTTLLGQVLGAHENAFLIDENDGLYPWFDDLLAAPEHGPVLPVELINRAAAKYVYPLSRVRGSEAALRLCSHVTHLILKAPNLSYHFEEVARSGLPIQIVHIARDPRAVVASMLRLTNHSMIVNQTARIAAHSSLAVEYSDELKTLRAPDTPDHVKAAHIWRIKTPSFSRFATLGLPCRWIRYEDLVHDRATIVRPLEALLGLAASERTVAHETCYRGKGPGGTVRSRSVDAASRDLWSSELTRMETKEIVVASRPEMLMLGYRPHYYEALQRASATVDPRALDAPQLKEPIVVLGRGGSGTRLLASALRAKGVFLGSQMNRSDDALEWCDLIHEIVLNATLAKSSRPISGYRNRLRRRAHDVLKSAGHTPNAPWGWKLPETLFILPEIHDAFPRARYIHLVRHPVVSALRRTHGTSRPWTVMGRIALAAAYAEMGWSDRDPSRQTEVLNNAVTWRHQVKLATDFLSENTPPDRHLTVKFEELASASGEVMARISGFLGLPPSGAPLPIDKARRNAAPKTDNTSHAEILDMCASVAARVGYDVQ